MLRLPHIHRSESCMVRLHAMTFVLLCSVMQSKVIILCRLLLCSDSLTSYYSVFSCYIPVDINYSFYHVPCEIELHFLKCEN